MSFHALVDEDVACDEESHWNSMNPGWQYAMRRAGWDDAVHGDEHAILIRFFPPSDRVIRITVPVELLNHLPDQQSYVLLFYSWDNNHPELQLKSRAERLTAASETASHNESKPTSDNDNQSRQSSEKSAEVGSGGARGG